MANPLDQLYKTKLQLVAVVAVVGGIAGLMLAHWGSLPGAPVWLGQLPVGEIGSTLFGTGLLAIFFEYVDRKHGDERTEQRIRAAVRNEAPAIRDAVLDSFAFNADALKGIASDETLDRISSNALGLRLGDDALAQEVYTDVRNQVIRVPERWRDLRISVHLAPEKKPTEPSRPMFVATVRREYRVRPAGPILRFASTGDLGEYRELLRDTTVAGQWYFQPKGNVDAGDRRVFELLQFSINGTERPIRRTERSGSQVYSVNLGKAAADDQEVTIAYTYRALVQQHGHLLYLDVSRPTKGINVQLSYTGSGIRYVNTLDFIASNQQARVETSPAEVAERAVNVSFDGWIFPRSGIAFIWVLDEELTKKSS